MTFQVAIYKFIAMHKSYHANFIFDHGGNSEEALKAVTEKPSLQHVSFFYSHGFPGVHLSTAESVALAFDKSVSSSFCVHLSLEPGRYGPGLVSNFRVDDNFLSKSTASFLDDQVTGTTGGHAMVLVGYRTGL
jgi:hypothetical protein